MPCAATGSLDLSWLTDAWSEPDLHADIYSMLRLRQDYRGPCRRLRRTADGALIDVGFQADGSYDGNLELAWADGGVVHVERWYNQSSAAGCTRPAYLEATGPGAPLAQQGSCLLTLAGHPAIEMQAESWLAPKPPLPVACISAISLLWIGAAHTGAHADTGLWSIHAEGIDDARTCEIDGFDPCLARDRGISFGRTAYYTHPGPGFHAASVIQARYAITAPYDVAAWIDGIPREVRHVGTAAGDGIGPAQLLGPNRVHSFIVDGAAHSGIPMIARRKSLPDRS